MKSKLILLLAVIFFSACNSEEPSKSYAGKFDLDGARAIAFSRTDGVSGGRLKENGISGLFKIEADGTTTSIADDVVIAFTETIQNGLFIVTADDNQNRFFISQTDKPARELDEWVDDFVGENDHGDLIFRDGKLFRKGERKFDKISSNLTNANVVASSGNFALITDGTVHQLVNTINNVRYNVSHCAAGQIVAISATKVIYDDCGIETLIDFSTGTREVSSINPFINSVRTEKGISVAKLNSASNQVEIVEYDQDAHEVNRFSYPNQSQSILQVLESEHYYVIQELTRVIAVDRRTKDFQVILSGWNVLSTSLANDNVLFYLAEDSKGNSSAGQLDLSTGKSISSNGQNHFDEVKVLEGR